MEIKLSCSKYLKKINKTEAIKNLFDFNIGSALTEIVGVDYDIEMKAFMILFNSSRVTNIQLSKAYGQKELNKKYNLVGISKAFDNDYKNFLEQNIVLRKEFFVNILNSDNSYLIYSYNLFRKFCLELKIDLPDDIRIHYYINFRENLQMEYQNNRERYIELEEFFKNPIALQNDKIAHLLDVYSNLKKFFTNPLQQDSLQKETLQDLYIEPFFSVYKNNFAKIPKKGENENFHTYSEKVSIHKFFTDYFLADRENKTLKYNYDMVFVLGQPGQGKTSFCYKLLYDYLENHSDLPPIPIVFMKIRELVAKDFINNPFVVVSEHHRYIDFNNDEFILILDGLDEAYMSGGITNNDLRNLYERLNKRSNKKIKIILTSRFNFLNIDDACLDGTLIIHLNELTDNQIKEYCKRFKKFYPKNSLVKSINSILDTKEYEHIKELLRQAVLIYFIAISDIEIEEKDSKSKIYDKIFDSLAQRSWDSNGQLDYINPKLKSAPSLYKSYLREYIRNIAFEIYHSPKLYITVNKLLELDATKLFIKRCFNDSIIDTPDTIKEFSKYLLISFYFQQTNKDNSDTALEFFHNSLWEFLTAEFIWEENKNILLRTDKYGELEIVSKEEYFEFLDKIVGQKSIDEFSIKQNLLEIITSESEEIRNTIFRQSITLFNKLLENDFLLRFQYKNGGLTSLEKCFEHFNIFWSFIHTSNTNEYIVMEEKGCSYLFQRDKFTHSNLKNVIISDDTLSHKLIIEDSIKDVKFISGYCSLECLTSTLENITFKEIYIANSIFRDNEFINLEFNDCKFTHYLEFFGNFFKNLIINNVQIDYVEWFKDFINDNTFDNDFEENHYVEKRIVKDYKNEDNEVFFIMNKTY